ncbi:MAG: 2,3-bisphosphoglycerate-independent phosphoglycerate mutase [Gammaproteobacteria bacterium]|nr:2,3-bisphosphoglycerate-independent phosphoglycerate mutase [Gammaproteobacteria bacterium]MBU1654262.1 2,3-bisphosphoglycerate-independent phosphoglycerate mutase [Gammaproteobacteria bacterium]MBU1960655.1 2,3-bisphosphoglycerate-independent phosphoglycerate mutase [Gammaproteobacteria bacterium]
MNEKNGVPRSPVVLIILDGFGVNPGKANNAVYLARTPNLDRYLASHPHATLDASGHAVGLPVGQMGNSEVGHLTLGAGHLVRQDLVCIDDSIRDHSFERNPALVAAVERAAAAGRPLHLAGLVSEGGVHSHMRHIHALIDLCNQRGVPPLLHMITDGRDTPPQSALTDVIALQGRIEQAGGKVATVIGRYYGMDRDHRWDRTELAWRTLVLGEGARAEGARQAIENSYAGGVTDEFIRPTVIGDYRGMADDDVLIFFNFRKDRPRQILSALFKEDFADFARPRFPRLHITCMMAYDRTFGLPYAFEPEKPKASLTRTISEAGIPQFHCAETEKYAHVTFFFNGGNPDTMPGEVHKLIPSPRVATYDLQPEMSAFEVANRVTEAICSGEYGFVLVNFANGDMVGHTAVAEAVVAAVEALDRAVGQVLDAAVENGYSVILTADHGNCEEMIDPATQSPHTQHTAYPVPCLVIDEVPWQLATGGGIANIAPTVLELMGLPKPPEMIDSLLLKAVSGGRPAAYG